MPARGGNRNGARSCFCGPARPPIRLQRTFEQETEEAEWGSLEGVSGEAAAATDVDLSEPVWVRFRVEGLARNIGVGVKFV